MSHPIDDLERQIVEETRKHVATKTKADDVLKRFKDGSERTKQMVKQYKTGDESLSRRGTPP